MSTPTTRDSFADRVIADLGERIGIPALQLDAAGGCQLAFDGRWLVTLIHAPAAQRWVLSCPLAPAHATFAADTQLAMLRANFMGAGCAGGVLAVAPDGRPCLQIHLADAEVNGEFLLARVETLLDQAELWADRVQRGEREPRANGPAATTLTDGERPPGWMLGRF